MSSDDSLNNLENSCEAQCAVGCYSWNVPEIIMENSSSHGKYALMILNRPITQPVNVVSKLWKNATITVTVDGGTKQWDTFLRNQPEAVSKTFKRPDLVTGDFDSISEEVLENYTKKGCKIIHTPDQNCTDFTKALMELNIHCNGTGNQIDYVITIGQASGRFDQTLGNIQTLFLARDKYLLNPNTKLYLLSDDSLSWLLNPGKHYITIPECSLKTKRVWCSLVPVGEPCKHVTSTGLKWNLDNQPLQYGQLVSTSNAFDGSKIVKIQCSHTLLWSMRIPSFLKP